MHKPATPTQYDMVAFDHLCIDAQDTSNIPHPRKKRADLFTMPAGRSVELVELTANR
jgi:hypothetical protein